MSRFYKGMLKDNLRPAASLRQGTNEEMLVERAGLIHDALYAVVVEWLACTRDEKCR